MINQKGQFRHKPICRLTLCMVKNSMFISTPLNHSPFSHERFDLEKIKSQRGNRIPLVQTVLDFTSRPFHRLDSQKVEMALHGKTMREIIFACLRFTSHRGSEQSLDVFTETHSFKADKLILLLKKLKRCD